MAALLSADASANLASFESEARGIVFYDVPASLLHVGLRVMCMLEPANLHDSNSIALLVGPHQVLGHLARESSQHLAPLLRFGFQAIG